MYRGLKPHQLMPMTGVPRRRPSPVSESAFIGCRARIVWSNKFSCYTPSASERTGPRFNSGPYKAKAESSFGIGLHWVQGPDLNRGPSGYEPDELPDCSTLQ
jgi:hypothetical protein